MGISATPILEIIVFTSGNFVMIFCSFLEASIDSERLLPGLISACIAISPSSNFGINSPPILLKINPATNNNATAPITTPALKRKAMDNSGLYTLLRAAIILSLKRSIEFSNLANQCF